MDAFLGYLSAAIRGLYKTHAEISTGRLCWIERSCRLNIISISGCGRMGNPIAAVYKKIPERQKNLIGSFLSVPLRVYGVANELRFKVYKDLEGDKLVYITSDKPDTAFVEFFYPGITITRVGTVYAWSLRSFVRRHDTVMVDIHSSFARFFPDGIITFRWIRQALHLSIPHEELFKNKERRRKIRKVGNFEPVFSIDPTDLDFFYDKIYLEYICKRHSDPTLLKKVLLQKDLGTIGELCFLKFEGRIVAGGFSTFRDGNYSLLTMGLTDDAPAKDDTVAALYYYGILRARERGAATIDFGISRPFIHDGVVKYKRKWGGKIERAPEINRVMYLRNIMKDGLIVLDDGKLKVLAGPENGEDRELAEEAGMEVKTI